MCLDVICRPDETCEPVTGECVADPCTGVHCPEGQRCAAGECEVDPTGQPDGGTDGGGPDAGGVDSGPRDLEERVLAAGGGGCVCAVGAQVPSGGVGGALAAVFVLGAWFLRRRRRG
jgi:MYXO-CTERM domain-containing protein